MKKLKFIILFLLSFIVILLINNNSFAATNIPKVLFSGDISNMTTKEDERNISLTYTSTDLNFTRNTKIKIQGSSSLSYDKKNYTINMYTDNTYTDKSKVDMEKGWGAQSKYCLKANWIDKTHSRNIVSARIAASVQDKYGMFETSPNNGTIDGFPVEVYINGEFLGLYTWNIPKDAWMWDLDKTNPNHIAIQAGKDTESTQFTKEITTLEESWWEVEVGESSQTTIDKFNRVIKFVNESSNEEFRGKFGLYINKESMLNYITMMYMTQSTDNIAKNMVLVTYDGNVWYPTLYDLDTTYGTDPWGAKYPNYLWLPNGEGEQADAFNPGTYKSKLINKFITCFPNEIADRWYDLRKTIFSKENIYGEFTKFQDSIPQSSLDKEKAKWANIPGDDYTQINDFLDVRLPYIDTVLYNKYTINAQLVTSYSNTMPTNQSVKVKVTPSRSDITITGKTEFTFETNGSYTFTGRDAKGNEVTQTATVNWIDKKAPISNVRYSELQNTNKDVVVTITSNEEVLALDGWELSADRLVLTKTYSSNQKEVVQVKDLVGNITEKTIEILNIDKQAPQIQIECSNENPTNQNVTVTITANEQIQQIEGWNLSSDKLKLTKVYTANESEALQIKDLCGNITQTQVNILNIDKQSPEITVECSNSNITNEDITVTITANEPVQVVDGWTLSSDKMKLSKIYKSNQTESIEVKDMAGNSTTKEIKIINIDKEKPVIEINYSEKDTTNKDVIVILTSNKELQKPQGWEISSDKKILNKTYEENKQETVIVKDIAGNEVTININICNIDKIAPQLKVQYSENETTNKDVIARITSNEYIQKVDGWQLSEDEKQLLKAYRYNEQEIVKVKDMAGNISEIKINITNIDKQAPKVRVNYSESQQTKESVVVNVISDEKLQELQGWTLSEDNTILNKKYDENVNTEITIKDIAGNSTTVKISIDNIQKDEAEKDDTKASLILPNAGFDKIVLTIVLVVVITILIVLYKKIKQYKDVK